MDASVVMDASVWVSWLVSYDSHHEPSILWVERYIAAGGLLVAPTLALIEIAATISRRTGQIVQSKETVKKLNSVSAMRFVPMDQEFVQAAVNLAAELKLRAGDATYVTVAHQLNIPLVSWDKEQLQRAASLVPTYTPSNYVFPTVPESDSSEGSDA